MVQSQNQQAQLDEVMLAMDVVDTLRHRQHLVERELNAELRDKQLVERLREIYAAQGIDVSDRVLKEGIEALKEERFVYQPPKPGLGVSLAKLYVSRNKWLKPLLSALVLLAAAALLYQLLVRGPSQRYWASLPKEFESQHQAIAAESHVPEATEQADRLVAEGQEALRRGDSSGVTQVLARLAALRADLEREYELRIVSRPGERSGIIRTPGLNPDAKNYYVVVEPVAPDGEVLTLPITSEEESKTASVRAWAVRVEKDLYDRVAADKKDDGIIQNRLLGVKHRGYLSPEYKMPTSGAAITEW